MNINSNEPTTHAAGWLLKRIPRGYRVSTFEIMTLAGLTEYHPMIDTLRELEREGLIESDRFSRWQKVRGES